METQIAEAPVQVVKAELCAPYNLTIPGRWAVLDERAARKDVLGSIDDMARTLTHATSAIGGLYLRMVDTIRDLNVSRDDLRETLSKHFPQQRVSEIIRVANAPREVYIKYRAGFFGFKAALRECRGYKTPVTPDLQRRKVRRAAERLTKLADGKTLEVKVLGYLVTVTPVT